MTKPWLGVKIQDGGGHSCSFPRIYIYSCYPFQKWSRNRTAVGPNETIVLVNGASEVTGFAQHRQDQQRTELRNSQLPLNCWAPPYNKSKREHRKIFVCIAYIFLAREKTSEKTFPQDIKQWTYTAGRQVCVVGTC